MWILGLKGLMKGKMMLLLNTMMTLMLLVVLLKLMIKPVIRDEDDLRGVYAAFDDH